MSSIVNRFASAVGDMNRRVKYALMAVGAVGTLLIGLAIGINIGRDNPEMSAANEGLPPYEEPVSPGDATGEGSEAPVPTMSHAAMGTPVTDDEFEFVVNNVERKQTVGDAYENYAAQGEWVLVYMTVRNIGKEPSQVNEIDQFLFDTSGARYDADLNASFAASGGGAESLNPGQSGDVVVAWDVPKGTTLDYVELHAFNEYGNNPSPGVTVSLKGQ